MKLNLNQTDSKVGHALLAVPMLDVIRFARPSATYATRKYADSTTRGERAELMAMALLDVVAYYPRQSGKEYGDLELADGSMVQVKTDGGQLGSSTGTVQDRLVRAYEGNRQRRLRLVPADGQRQQRATPQLAKTNSSRPCRYFSRIATKTI